MKERIIWEIEECTGAVAWIVGALGGAIVGWKAVALAGLTLSLIVSRRMRRDREGGKK